MQQTISLDTPAGPRSYLAHVPPGHAGALPVVVMLHGAGGTAAWTLAETGWASLADREGFLLVLPEATRPDPTLPPSFLQNPQVWNDGSAYGEPPRPAVDDVSFLAEVVADVRRRFAVDAERTYLTGFSNGASMTFRLAAERPELFAAIAPLAGYCYLDNLHLSRPVPTLFMVGAADPLVPLSGGDIVTPWGRQQRSRPGVRNTLLKWAKALGCATTAIVVREEDGALVEHFPGPVPFLAYTIDGLGHHWPGGRGELNRRIAGPPSNRVRACEELWRFFRQFQLG